MMIRIFTEAFVVGISTLLMGLLVHFVFGYHAKHSQSPTMGKEMVDLSLTLFFTGVFLHLLFEGVKLNFWYCKNGNACL